MFLPRHYVWLDATAIRRFRPKYETEIPHAIRWSCWIFSRQIMAFIAQESISSMMTAYASSPDDSSRSRRHRLGHSTPGDHESTPFGARVGASLIKCEWAPVDRSLRPGGFLCPGGSTPHSADRGGDRPCPGDGEQLPRPASARSRTAPGSAVVHRAEDACESLSGQKTGGAAAHGSDSCCTDQGGQAPGHDHGWGPTRHRSVM